MYYFIQAIGTHCTGKSRAISSIGLSYGVNYEKKLFSYSDQDNCSVLGRYTRRVNKKYTGGFDACSVSVEERKKYIRQLWESKYKITMVEGFMLGYYNTFLNWYKTLSPKRKVILIFLDVSTEIIKDRLVKRSGGKQWTKKRSNHVMSKMKVCENSLKEIENDNFFTYKVLKNECDNDLLEILRYVESETGIKMNEYLIDMKSTGNLKGWF